MSKILKIFINLIIFLLLMWGSVACQSTWSLNISDGSGDEAEITSQEVLFYIEKSEEVIETLPLGQLFYHHGYTLIDTITIETSDGESTIFNWDKIAPSTFISPSGEISIEKDGVNANQILVEQAGLSEQIDYSIMDIAPTVATALGLPELINSSGNVRFTPSNPIDHAVMILLDGLQYAKLETSINNGDLPFLHQLGKLHKGLTVYPPITTTATASLLTGSPPKITGVYGYGYRSTEEITLFDLASEAGKKVIAVEGASLPFNLRNAETILSGDRDGNGFSDDNVFKNSLEIIQNEMPDLLYIHFHEIDDMGHSYGPDSPQYLAALQRVDQYLEQILDAVPPNTLIAIFADHGMHTTEEGGNHGTLTEQDLVIPIIFLEK
jgi:hypothetical protein